MRGRVGCGTPGAAPLSVATGCGGEMSTTIQGAELSPEDPRFYEVLCTAEMAEQRSRCAANSAVAGGI